jgi:arsenate reductase (thioredoxin)
MKIAFLCVANSARSQMAEGLARSIFDKDVVVQSAGSEPTAINPMAIQAMAERGIDISAQHSKSLSSLNLQNVDIVVTLCADEVCPYVPGKIRREHWPLPDPAALCENKTEQYQRFREVRDELKTRIMALKEELIASGQVHCCRR